MNSRLIFFSIHHGENKAAIPKVWPLAEKQKFAVVKEAFISFLGTCYCTFFYYSLAISSELHFSRRGTARARFTPSTHPNGY